MPPLAVIVPALEIGMLTVPKPVMSVLAARVPKPLIVPFDSVMSLATVSTDEAPSWILPLVTVCAAPLIVRLTPVPVSSVWLALVIEIGAATVVVAENFRVDADAVAIVNATPLATVPFRFSTPPLAVIVFAPLPTATFAATVPKPVSDAPLPIEIPLVSVSVPPLSTILPLVKASAPLMVRLPPVPISSVWLTLLIEIKADVVDAVPENFRVDADAVAIANVAPLATVPARFSTPPLAVIVPVPVAMFAATVPDPIKSAPLPIVSPDAMVNKPPSSWIVPLVMLSTALMVRLPAAPICRVWSLSLIEIAAADIAVPSSFRVELAAVPNCNTTPLSTVPNTLSVPPPSANSLPPGVVTGDVQCAEALHGSASCKRDRARVQRAARHGR